METPQDAPLTRKKCSGVGRQREDHGARSSSSVPRASFVTFTESPVADRAGAIAAPAHAQSRTVALRGVLLVREEVLGGRGGGGAEEPAGQGVGVPHPGKQWAERGGKHKDPDREPRRRRRATYNRYGGVRHLFTALVLAKDKLYGHIKPVKRRTQFLEFCRYLHTLYPDKVRIAIICDNFSPHLTTKKWQRVGTWAAANNVEIAYTPTDSSWLNRIEAQFTALRYFTLDGADHATHKKQGSMIRRYIIWRNRHADDQHLRTVVDRANVA
jgi:transposase